jgi:hypothetical protein
MRNHQTLKRLVPITALRHLYRLLRDFAKEEFQLAVATEFNRRPDQLVKLIAESREHFALYDNREEPFHDRGSSGALTGRRQVSGCLADRFVVDLAGNERRSADCEDPNLNFYYVDYDIGTRRTTNSELENGKPASRAGTGGVDLLLSNAHDQTPIVGEIKADTDVNPFLGLIQSLMYAVELSTEPQRARLCKFYPSRFSEVTDPVIDIYLILLRYPQDQLSQKFLSLTNQISASLLTNRKPGIGFIRRIVALESPLPQPMTSFSVAFSHDQTK